jgi:pimeloyl-ACP methyl ester carboxylesterase
MAGVKTPWLACGGRHDGAVPPGIMEATTMTWFETAEIALFEDSGHYPMLEIPPHLAKAIQDFMLRYA